MAPETAMYNLSRVDSTSDSNKDDSVRSGCAMEIGGSPNVLLRTQDRDEDGHVRRTGNVWTASAHVITAVIGSGVLSLAWSMAQVGWVAGPPILLGFAFVTYYCATFLANAYRHPVTGRRNYTYKDAVKAHLGKRQVFFCGLVQYVNLVGTAIGYTITASISMVAIHRSNCFYKNGHDATCHTSNNPYMILFGVVEIIISQIPDFDRLWWLSIVAAVMSFSYSSIGLGLAVGKASEKGHSYGSISGVEIGVVSKVTKAWNVFQALGNIAFAYSFSMILIEIQDTLKSPPPEKKTMKKATLVGILVTTLYYMSIGCIGYAAFGDDAPGNLLTGFGFYNPYWLVDLGNACIVVHLVGAYQVFTQPVFAFVEKLVTERCPPHSFLTREYTIPLPFEKTYKLCWLRLVWRSCFVVVTTVVAMILPFFNDILGILGALAFWPLTVYFPIAMHISRKQIKPWSKKWVGLQSLSMFCLVISTAAAIGSIAGIAADLQQYAPFKMNY